MISLAVATPGTLLYQPHARAAVDIPTIYDVNFTSSGIRYHYTVEAMPWGIGVERLHAYPKGVSRLLFHRTQQGPDAPINVATGPSLTGPTAEVKRLVTSTDLLLAVAARYEHKTLAPISRDMAARASVGAVNHSKKSLDDWVQWLVSRMIEDPTRWQAIAKALVNMADLGIINVEVQEEQIPPEVLVAWR